MSKWYTVNCGHCGCEISVHEDWDKEPEYCKDCSWISETCEICGGELMIHRGWSNPPVVHKECRERERAKWHEKRCGHCGDTIKYHEDWDNVPNYCKNCTWYEVSCEICGGSIRVHRDWDNPPRVHKECREKARAKWRARGCDNCGREIRYHQDWDKVPRYCEKCLWYEVECNICKQALKICREWEKPPRAHKDCLDRYRPRQENCMECGESFTISTGLQLKCKEQGWNLPTKCPQCKQDSILISGAIAAAKEHFGFAVKAVIEPRGFFFPQKVAVIYSKKTGEALAEVKMEDRGFFLQIREAVARDLDGKTLSKTREAREGFFTDRRVADTYAPDNAEKTHRTRDTTEGIIFTKRVRETENLKTGDKTKVRPGTEGFISPKSIQKTDK
jgi:hypothetical protein